MEAGVPLHSRIGAAIATASIPAAPHGRAGSPCLIRGRELQSSGENADPGSCAA
jgi:hypothetical protein